MRGGALNDASFGSRFKGQGVEAALLARRFEVACRRVGLNREKRLNLDTTAFRPPAKPGDQLSLEEW
jgi:hypothetical protein